MIYRDGGKRVDMQHVDGGLTIILQELPDPLHLLSGRSPSLDNLSNLSGQLPSQIDDIHMLQCSKSNSCSIWTICIEWGKFVAGQKRRSCQTLEKVGTRR